MNAIFFELLRFTPISLRYPLAWIGHIPFASYLARRFRPGCFVELGTHYGNSYFAFCQTLKEERVPVAAYAVDSWHGDEQATFYSEDVFAYVSQHNTEHYAGFSSLLRMQFDEAAGSFSDGSIDLLHIDGYHTYEAVSHDFRTWLPKLAPGAIVLLHDVNVRQEGYGAWKFWEELRSEYANTFGFLHSHGLGVVQLEGGSPDKLLDVFALGPKEQREFAEIFAALGAMHQYRYRQDELQQETAALRRALAERDAVLAEKEASLAALGAALAEKGETLAETQAVLNSVIASNSWRITRPLRAAMAYARKRMA